MKQRYPFDLRRKIANSIAAHEKQEDKLKQAAERKAAQEQKARHEKGMEVARRLQERQRKEREGN